MIAPYRVLVLGRNGQLAHELARASWPATWVVTFIGRPEMDLCVPDRAAEIVAAAKADLVINAAAYTDVERAETDANTASLVNSEAPAAIARACASTGKVFISISSDYVFNGRKSSPYVEDDPVDPINFYGLSKVRGEALIREKLDRHIILRTSWLFSPFGINFVTTMVQLGRNRRRLCVVGDQTGCPTSARDLAASIIAICRTIQAGGGLYGTFHATNAGATTWHGFAEAIFCHIANRGGTVPGAVLRITTSEYPTSAARPANSILDCGHLQRSYGIEMPTWRTALAVCLDEIIDETKPKWR